MKKTLLVIITAMAALVFGQAFAASNDSAKGQTTEETAILASLNKKYPNTKITSIRKAEMGDLYEVVVGRNIAYVDKDTNYFMFGHIFDMTTQRDLTKERMDEVAKVDFYSLPLDKAIKIVKGDGGNGKRVFALFTDPECPFCKRLEQQSIPGIDNYTMYVFLFPIPQLHPAAMSKAVAIWCSKNRAAAYHEALTEGIDETKVKPCKTPLDEIQALGQSLQVQGTPTLIRVDGARLPGAAPADQLNLWLDQAKLDTKAAK